MNKKLISIICGVLLLPASAFACLNGETKTLKNGYFVYEDYAGNVPHGHEIHLDRGPELIKELDRLYARTRDLDYLSDKGYILVVQRKFAEALELFLQIEKLQPNRYSTAANIGTIYELLGDNDKAYQWISKAIRINPKSHEGSEWLHLKILEAKRSGNKDLSTRFFLDTDFGTEANPVSNLSKKKRELLEHSLYYQLNERMTFIKNNDPIMARLLFDLADLHFVGHQYNDAKAIYKLAEEYGFDKKITEERIGNSEWEKEFRFRNHIDRLQKANRYHQTLFAVTLVISLVIVSGLLFWIWKMKRRQTASN